ncbi:MAG: hypothetical protein U0166_23125 [Acidobacteriota bacterium]
MELARPPRSVSIGTRLTLRCGMLTQIGFLLIGFGTPFFWGFFPFGDIAALAAGAGGVAHAQARVSREPRSFGAVNGIPVFRMTYVYQDAAKKEHEGRAYATGASLSVGDELAVTYARLLPQVSKADGFRASAFGPAGSLVTIFPLIGLLLASFGMRAGGKAISLLVWGKLALGRLVAREATNVTINERPVYRLTFEFEDDRGAVQRGFMKTHRDIGDTSEQVLLYDGDDPSRIYLVNALPSGVDVDQTGQPLPVSFARAAFASFLPTLAIAGNLLILFLRFRP